MDDPFLSSFLNFNKKTQSKHISPTAPIRKVLPTSSTKVIPTFSTTKEAKEYIHNMCSTLLTTKYEIDNVTFLIDVLNHNHDLLN